MLSPPRTQSAAWFDSERSRVVQLLTEYVGEQASAAAPNHPNDTRLVVTTATHRFRIEARAAATAGPLLKAAQFLLGQTRGGRVTPLIVVPYMGRTGSAALEELGMSWLDLSGNALIKAPGLHVDVRGRANRFVQRGRPPNLFAPKASRVVRCMLIHPRQWLTQRAIAKETELGEGHVSKLVRRLEAEKLVERNGAGAVRPSDCQLLLEEWRGRSDFSRNQIHKGQLLRKSGEQRLRELAKLLADSGRHYAATGLAAAWLLAPHAQFRLTTLYVRELPPEEELAALGWRSRPRAPDTWLVVPRDAGVFHGSTVIDGVTCVHPVQAYVDLAEQPERAKEAAAELMQRRLAW